ncbi:MAG TPA: cytochrome c oxidase subunit II [Candidatus Binatia bacterium]|nr:cytochrome c oxidase subunit II [Candidatus Binatia bacterium]
MKRMVTPLVAWTAASALILFLSLTQIRSGNAQAPERVIKITAHKFAYEPDRIDLKVGEPVVLELTSKDVTHGFKIPDLGLRADLEPGETARVRLVPEKVGTFEFYCDNFCGIDHENMSATIVVHESDAQIEN